MKMDDLRGRYDDRLREGKHTLSATYLVRMKSAVSFRIVIDKAKSIALLEEIAEAAPRNGNEDDASWARQQLEKIRLPSLSGVVTDAAGRPLKEVEISVTGPYEMEHETRANGRYYFDELTRGATYTLTPSLRTDDKFEATYTFEPASRTVTNLNSKLHGLNFVGTKARPSTNVAEDQEGATAKASSTQYPTTNFQPTWPTMVSVRMIGISAATRRGATARQTCFPIGWRLTSRVRRGSIGSTCSRFRMTLRRSRR
jgi:hypothetical protein